MALTCSDGRYLPTYYMCTYHRYLTRYGVYLQGSLTQVYNSGVTSRLGSRDSAVSKNTGERKLISSMLPFLPRSFEIEFSASN